MRIRGIETAAPWWLHALFQTRKREKRGVKLQCPYVHTVENRFSMASAFLGGILKQSGITHRLI